MRPRKIIEQLIFVAVIAVLLGFGYWQGLVEMNVLGFSMLEAEFSIIGFSVFIFVSSLLFINSLNSKEEEKEFDREIAALVPTYHDAHVLENSVGTLLDSSYDKLTVKIISEPEDVEGVAKAEELAEKHDAVESVVNEKGNSKAAAINHTIENSDEDVFAVFDADQKVDEDFISTSAGYLNDHDVVQGRFIPETNSLIGSLSYYEYALFGHCFRQIVFLLSKFRMAASKSILFTREAFEKAGKYDENVVTEDYDFAHKCYRNHVDVKMIHSEVTTEESVHNFSDWWGQRKRWMTGNMQVLHKMLGLLPGHLGKRRYYLGVIMSIGSIGGSMFLVGILPKFIILFQQGYYGLMLAPVAGLYLAAIPSRIMDYRKGNANTIGWEAILVPFTLPIFSLITIKAAIEYFISWDGEWFSVDK